MTVDLGTSGIWMRRTGLTPDLAREIEALGFGAIWIGGSPAGDLALAESLLDATDRIAVATGIVNMWTTPAAEVAPSYHRIEKAHPGRFLLGVGIGHPEATTEYRSPFATIVSYLDALDAAGVPKEGRALAALGPKVLKVSAERTAGAHPYLTTPEHTREARELVGPGVLLAPEQKVVLETDPELARHRAPVGRPPLPAPAQLRRQPQAAGLDRRGHRGRGERRARRRPRDPRQRRDGGRRPERPPGGGRRPRLRANPHGTGGQEPPTRAARAGRCAGPLTS